MNRAGLLAASALVAVGLGGSTYAIWNDDANQSSGVVQAGDLDISLVDGIVWHDSDNKVIDPSTYFASAGESFTVEQKFKSKLDGENILGKLSTSWGKPDTLNKSVATYSVLDGAGKTVVENVKLGDPSTINNIGESNGEYTLKINLKLDGDSLVKWVSLPTDSKGSGNVDLGSIKLDLDQVRSGNGYK